MNHAAMSAARRGSFWATWRLFSGGAGRVWTTVLVMVLPMAMPFLFTGHSKAIPFAFCAGFVVFCLGFGTWHLEAEMSDRVAYLGTVAQPVDTRNLLLAPMCALAVLLTIMLTVIGRLPVGAALSLLGAALWTVAGTRWLWKLRFWLLFALPILIADPAAAYFVNRLAGWGVAAAVSLSMAIGALAFQPRPYVGEPLSRRMSGGTAKRPPSRSAVRGAVSAAIPNRGWLASAARFSETRPLVLIMIMIVSVGLGLAFPLIGYRSNMLMGAAMIPGVMMAAAYSGDMHEFLRPRPYDPVQRLVGSLVPPLFLALLGPAVALVVVHFDGINHGGLIILFRRHTPGQDEIQYMRLVLGATFLPDKWPAGGLPRDLWERLRPFLYMDVLRAALLAVSIAFAVPIRKVGERPNHGTKSVTSIAILLAVFGTIVVIGLSPLSGHWPIPHLWFLALLAVVSIAHWVWRVRVVSAPSKAGGG